MQLGSLKFLDLAEGQAKQLRPLKRKIERVSFLITSFGMIRFVENSKANFSTNSMRDLWLIVFWRDSIPILWVGVQ